MTDVALPYSATRNWLSNINYQNWYKHFEVDNNYLKSKLYTPLGHLKTNYLQP